MAELFVTVAGISVGTSVLIAILLFVSPRLAKRYPARSLCAVWLVLALRLLIPATFRLPAPVSIPVPELGGYGKQTVAAPDTPAEAAGVSAPASPAPGQKDASGPAGEPARTGPTAGDVLVAVWAAGALTFAAVRLTGYALLRRRVRRTAAPVDDAAAQRVFREVLSGMRIPEGRVALLRLPGATGPMMTGLFRPVILMPEKLVSDRDELALIFRHELVHYRRRHIWYKLALMCANAAHWFNPLVWYLAREANAQLENACDQEIVRGADLGLRKKYCRSILSAAALGQQNKTGLRACLNGRNKSMKKRFDSIFDQTAKRRGAPLVVFVLLAVLLAGALVSCRSAGGASGAAGDTSPSPSPSADAGADADVTPSDTAAVSSEPTDVRLDEQTVARIWADAVQARDGKGQYGLLTKALQESVYEEFSDLNWVTGTSSPWVDSYELNKTPDGVTVLYHYAASSGPAGIYEQKLTFAEEDGLTKISAVSEPVRVDGETAASPTPNPSSGPSGGAVQTTAPSPAPAPSGGAVPSPTSVPSAEPTSEPSSEPSPTPEPSAGPTAEPSPTPEPSAGP